MKSASMKSAQTSQAKQQNKTCAGRSRIAKKEGSIVKYMWIYYVESRSSRSTGRPTCTGTTCSTCIRRRSICDDGTMTIQKPNFDDARRVHGARPPIHPFERRRSLPTLPVRSCRRQANFSYCVLYLGQKQCRTAHAHIPPCSLSR